MRKQSICYAGMTLYQETLQVGTAEKGNVCKKTRSNQVMNTQHDNHYNDNTKQQMKQQTSKCTIKVNDFVNFRFRSLFYMVSTLSYNEMQTITFVTN